MKKEFNSLCDALYAWRLFLINKFDLNYDEQQDLYHLHTLVEKDFKKHLLLTGKYV